MRQLAIVLGIAFLVIGSVAGCGKTDVSKTGASGSTTPGTTPSAKLDLPASAKVQAMGVCCAKCEKRVVEVLGKVSGIGDVRCDVDKRVVTYRAKDSRTAIDAYKALRAAGWAGDLSCTDPQSPDDVFITTGQSFGGGAVDMVVFKDVHACCPGCEKAIKARVMEFLSADEVSFSGTGTQKTVTIKGKGMPQATVENAIFDAGYAEPSNPRGIPTIERRSSSRPKGPAIVTAEVKGIYICCATCEKDAKAALAKVPGVSDVQCDLKKRIVTYKAKDGNVANEGLKTLNAAGFGGVLKHDGPPETQFTVVGNFLGDFGKWSEIRIKDVHVCCEGCEKAIKEVFKGSDVTFAGSGSQKEVVLKGKDLNSTTVMGQLIAAGFYGNPSAPTK